MAYLQVGSDATLQGPSHKVGYFFGTIKAIEEKPSKSDTTKSVLHVAIVPDPSYGLPSGVTAKFYIGQGSDGKFSESNVLRLCMAAWRTPLDQARHRLMSGVDTSSLIGGSVFYSVAVEPKKEGEKYDNTIVMPLVATEIQEAVGKGLLPQTVLAQISAPPQAAAPTGGFGGQQGAGGAPFGGQQPAPGGFQQPAPGGFQQPAPGGFQGGGFQQPAPQAAPGGFQGGGFQQPAPGGFQGGGFPGGGFPQS